MKILLTLLFLGLFSALWSQEDNAQRIIDRAIESHGGSNYDEVNFSFQFRKYGYVHFRKYSTYRYERHHADGLTKDILDNDGFSRQVNDKKVKLSAKDSNNFSNSVNSVIYFAFLPYFLNDAAVMKKTIGTEEIRGKQYFKIQVTFMQEGGGDDFDDIYVYWINQEDYKVDYLAYSFHVNGGGVRFREAYNRRIIDGITFQDYVNYKHNKNTPVQELGKIFDNGGLTELSRIELKNIEKIEG